MNSDVALERARHCFAVGDFSGAEQALLPVISRQSPVDDRLLYGVILARLRKAPEAFEVLEGVLKDAPDTFEAITWMAIVCTMLGRAEEALGHAQRAVQLRPGESAAYGTLGDCLLSLRRLDDAVEALRRAIELSEDDATVRHNLGIALGMQGKTSRALEAYEDAIRLAPNVPANYLAPARLMLRHAMAGDAIDKLTAGLKAIPGHIGLMSELASAYAQARNPEAAERMFLQVLNLSPRSRLGYANWLQGEGRFEEAAALYEASLHDGVNPGQAFDGLMQVRKLGEQPGLMEAMLALKDGPELPIRQRMYLHYALGRAHDALKDPERAMHDYDAANADAYRIYQMGRAFDVAEMRSTNDLIFERYAPLLRRDTSERVERPIFIVGMIRSGTTLLEQIVSSHPEVGATGELRYWLEEGPRLAARSEWISPEEVDQLAEGYIQYVRLITGDKPAFTDKMPLNYGLMGAMAAAFPRGRILHIRRNPVDTCLSIWMTFFGGGPQFAYDKHNIVRYYREYLRVVDRWRAVLSPQQFMELDYEDLIESREQVTRKVIEFCGLNWDEACLHHEDNTGTINTPSRWQARQPVYKTSLAKWVRYKPFLGEFRELLP